MPTDKPPYTSPLICPICDDEIEDDDGTEEGGVIFHFMCCPDDGGHDAE